MALVQTTTVTLPKLKLPTSGKMPIPVVRHVIRNEDFPNEENVHVLTDSFIIRIDYLI